METLKKYFPFLILVLGVLFLVVGIFVFVNNRNKATKVEKNEEAEEEVLEIPFEKRPFVKLIPSKDGHWLKLSVSEIKVKAKTLDYELLYKLPDGRTQGVPGTIELKDDNFERDILLGSESSGKFRYDEGVKEGTLTLRFRNEAGKLVGKLSGGFTLNFDSDLLSSSDGKFNYELSEVPKGVYLVVCDTFGTPVLPEFKVVSGPYGIFTSSDKKISGSVKNALGQVYYLDNNSWIKLDTQKPSSIGIFALAE